MYITTAPQSYIRDHRAESRPLLQYPFSGSLRNAVRRATIDAGVGVRLPCRIGSRSEYGRSALVTGDAATRLAFGGLRFLEYADLECLLIIPRLARRVMALPTPPGHRLWSAVDTPSDDYIAKANEGWFDISSQGGLFGEDREFYVPVPIRRTSENEDYWWAHVHLEDEWDVMGRGSEAILGIASGRPAFAMLSLSGDTAVSGDVWEAQIGSVLVSGIRDVRGFREACRKEMERPKTSVFNRDAIGRWLKSVEE